MTLNVTNIHKAKLIRIPNLYPKSHFWLCAVCLKNPSLLWITQYNWKLTWRVLQAFVQSPCSHLLTDQNLWQAKKEAIKFLEEKTFSSAVVDSAISDAFRKWKNEIWSDEYADRQFGGRRATNYCFVSNVFFL